MSTTITRAQFEAASPVLMNHRASPGGPMQATVTDTYSTDLGYVRHIHSMGGEKFYLVQLVSSRYSGPAYGAAVHATFVDGAWVYPHHRTPMFK